MRLLCASLALMVSGCHLVLGDEYTFPDPVATGGGGAATTSASSTATTGSGVSCLPVPPTSGCGDAVCDAGMGGAAGESCATCPVDCGLCCTTACGNNGCEIGTQCCTPPPATFSGQPYGVMGTASWTFGGAQLSSIAERICFNNDPGRVAGLAYQLYDGAVDGAAQSFGFQTDAEGSRAIFTRFGTTDPSAVRAGPGATAISSDTDGAFVSVRLDLPLGVGCFDVTVERAEASGEADWFDMKVRRACDATEVVVGGILFPRAVAGTKASFLDGGGSALEVYTAEPTVFDIPFVDFDVTPTANGAKPVSVKSSYTIRPNADVDLTVPGTARFRAGLRTARCHAAMTVPL